MIFEFNNSSYSIDDKLVKLWEKHSLERVKKTNSDRFYIVDGRERIGKSTWTFQQACYIDPAMRDVKTFISRICFTPDEFDEAVRTVKNGVIIFDEAFRGFSSRAALSKTNKRLITTLMEMGQNNNIVFLVLPSFFMLDIYPAMLRSNTLFNIYMDRKYNKRSFRGFNQKDKNRIYQAGIKRGWSYKYDSRFKGRFYDKFPGGEEFLKAYLKKKADALKSMRVDIDSNGQVDGKGHEWEEKFEKLLYAIRIGLDLSEKRTSEVLTAGGYEIAPATIGLYTRKYKEKLRNPPKN